MANALPLPWAGPMQAGSAVGLAVCGAGVCCADAEGLGLGGPESESDEGARWHVRLARLAPALPRY